MALLEQSTAATRDRARQVLGLLEAKAPVKYDIYLAVMQSLGIVRGEANDAFDYWHYDLNPDLTINFHQND